MSLPTQTPAGGPFTDQHARGVLANTYGGFSIRFKDGRAVFPVGERIPLELVYERPGYGLYSNRAEGQNSEKCVRIYFDRSVAGQPRIDSGAFFDGVPGGILGGVTSTPAIVDMTLTDLYRFDAPGRYRMFIQSRQITQDFETSNILDFEVLPRDRVRETRVLEDATKTLAEPGRDSIKIAQAFAALRALRTNEPTAMLARFYETDDDELAGRDEIWNGLVSNPDRAFTLDALVSELTNPDRRIGSWFIRGLALLQILTRAPAGPPSHDEYLAAVRQLAVLRAQALKTIPGRLETEMGRELSSPADPNWFVGGGITAAARDFPREAAEAFRALPAEAQRSRLIGTWRTFADPIFLPLLSSLYESPAENSNAVRDIALRRLYQLAPEEGRPAMLAEIGRDSPRVSIQTLGMLPERAFPQLESRWVQLLGAGSTAEQRTSAAQRLERFGTASMAASVENLYDRAGDSLTCITRAALLAYLVRVDARHGERLLTSAATGALWDESCGSSLITEVAALEWSDPVERAAVRALRSSDLVLVPFVAYVLGEHGSAAVRRPLEIRLQEVQSKLAAIPRRADRDNWREVRELELVEQELARALNGAKSWLLTNAERDRFARRCSHASETSGHCGGAFDLDEASDPPHSVTVFPRIGDEGQFEFFLGSYGGRSLEDLEQKLRQFPSGTRIHWRDRSLFGRMDDSLFRWTQSERDAVFENFRRRVAGYGIILQRERKFTGHDPASCPE